MTICIKPGHRLARGLLAGAAALALAACNGFQLQPEPMAFFDLGLNDVRPLPAALSPAQVEVVTPPWLGVSAMQYRLAWNEPARRRAFAESRWVAQPADMLGLALNRSLRAQAGGHRCRLRIEVDEFVQIFDSAERSRVDVVVRAGLLPPRSDAPLALREFRVGEGAVSADAPGGVEAYRVAVQRLAGELAQWIVTLDRESGQGLNSPGRCGA